MAEEKTKNFFMRLNGKLCVINSGRKVAGIIMTNVKQKNNKVPRHTFSLKLLLLKTFYVKKIGVILVYVS